MSDEYLNRSQPVLFRGACGAMLSTPQFAVPGWHRVVGPFLSPVRSVHGRSLPRDIETEPVDAAEWRRECSGFIASFVVHMVMIFVLALMVTPTEQPGAVITIISQPSSDEPIIDFAEFEMPELPFEQPNPIHEHADSEAASAGIEGDSAPESAQTFALIAVVPEPPAHVEDIGLKLTDRASLLTAVGQDAKGDGLDIEGIGANVEFYGVQATGRRFVFVTDCSSSMEGEPLKRLKEQLRKSIGDLPVTAEFYIVFFNDRAIPMPSAACVRAAPRHVRMYLDWVDQVQSTGGTDPSQAMTVALALKPSVVFLLTDGMFQPAPTEAVIGSLNKDRKVQINTIAIGERGSEPVLRRIAKENRGTYTFVPNR